MALDLLGDPVELLVVDGDDAPQQVEVVAGVLGDVDQRLRVLGEAASRPSPGPGRRNSWPMRLS